MDRHSTIISPVDTSARRSLDLHLGDTVKVWQKIKEGGKTRLQAFEGLVIARKHGAESGGTFTVRHVLHGIGFEKIFPLYSPLIDKIEILKQSRVRRSKLYHIRDKAATEVRRQMRNIRTVKGDVTVSAQDKPKEESKETAE